MDRSSKAEVRNPILSLPSAARLGELDKHSREIVVSILRDIQADSRDRADKCWRTHKAPMAAYWKAVSVYAGHISRAIRKVA